MSRTFQFIADHLDLEKAEGIVSGSEHAHLKRVLRLKVGDELLVSDGKGALYQAVIREMGGDRTLVRLLEAVPGDSESPLHMTLIQALPKGKKWDWILQKATELGVRQIVPVLSERSVPRVSREKEARKRERWRQILKEAAKQSYRAVIPTLMEVMSLEEALAANGTGLKLLCAPEAKRGLRECLNEGVASEKVVVAIGPEGGFSDREIQLARRNGFAVCHLGPRTLRLETAVVKVLSVLQYVLGDG